MRRVRDSSSLAPTIKIRLGITPKRIFYFKGHGAYCIWCYNGVPINKKTRPRLTVKRSGAKIICVFYPCANITYRSVILWAPYKSVSACCLRCRRSPGRQRRREAISGRRIPPVERHFTILRGVIYYKGTLFLYKISRCRKWTGSSFIRT